MIKPTSQSSSDAPDRSKQRPCSDEFRRDVVRLITDEGYSILAAANACGVSDQTVRNWYGRFAPTPEAAADEATVEELRAEVARLRQLLSEKKRNSLVEWFNLYMGIEGRAGSEHTFDAKKRDLETFLRFLQTSAGTDHADQWTRSLTRDFLRHLERKLERSPTTINRVLASLRHCASWVNSQRPFLAGNPCDRIPDLELDDPQWKGLKPIDVTRLKSAAEQLIYIQRRVNQHPVRNCAIFMSLPHTGLRVSELLSLNLSQYEGKHFRNVKRKGKAVSRKVFLSKDAREALDAYVDEHRGRENGPLFCSATGQRLARQAVDEVLKGISAQANVSLPPEQQIHVSAHILRHTFLREVAVRYGVQYAKELAGHASDRYIWRYVQPSDEEKQEAVDGLF